MRAAVAAALVLVLAGCGGTARQRPASALTPAGMLFGEKCGGCHTLAAADTHGSASKSFDELQPTAATVLQAIATGPGAMPAHLLTGADAQAIARFVARESR
ncbi:MAG: cytochrome c [Actinomycetota bacterium]